MRIVFMGSAPLACPSLEALLADNSYDVLAVVTQPDRPKGRSLRISACAVKVFAQNRGIAVLTPSNVNTSESINAVKQLKPDLIVVVAYGQILKKEVLGLPPEGCVNMHASLLPKYRGAAPIQWAIANGEQVTGVTTIFMSERMDAGDIILQKEVAIGHEDTAGSLHDKLAQEGAVLLSRTVEAIHSGRVTRTQQVEAEATFAPKLKREDGRIDWTKPAGEIYNRVRGFNPWPVCWCAAPTNRVRGEKTARLRVLKVRVENDSAQPGEVIDVSGGGPLVGTGEKSVRLLEVQPEGRKVMNGVAYLRGHGLKIGDMIG